MSNKAPMHFHSNYDPESDQCTNGSFRFEREAPKRATEEIRIVRKNYSDDPATAARELRYTELGEPWPVENIAWVFGVDEAIASEWVSSHVGTAKSEAKYQQRTALRTARHRRLAECLRKLFMLPAGHRLAETIIPLDRTIPRFEDYVRSRFLPGMTWDNFGVVWTIDFVRPLASFDHRDERQIYRAFHYSNLAPVRCGQAQNSELPRSLP